MSEWIPVSEETPDARCIACDKFGQIFIPMGVVAFETDKGEKHSYDARHFEFDVSEFLKGCEVIVDGEKVRALPVEIIAWQPLPRPYKTLKILPEPYNADKENKK